MKRQILSEEFKRMQKLAGINEGEGVASDGGYYTKPERGIVVSRKEADRINQAIEHFKQDIQDPKVEIIMVNPRTEQGQMNWKIIQDLQKNWNVKFENDNEEGISYFKLTPGEENMRNALDGLEHADQLFYDEIS